MSSQRVARMKGYLMRTPRQQIGRLLGAVAAAVTLIASAATPAQATQPPPSNCFKATGPTYGAWSVTKQYDFAAGTFCMYNPAEPKLRLVFQSDGNFVVYDNLDANYPGAAKWASNTSGRGTGLSFQKDGNVVIYDINHVAVWASNPSTSRTSTSTFRMTFERRLPTPPGWTFHVQQSNPYASIWTSPGFA
jgi:hypothetical protein